MCKCHECVNAVLDLDETPHRAVFEVPNSNVLKMNPTPCLAVLSPIFTQNLRTGGTTGSPTSPHYFSSNFTKFFFSFFYKL